MITCDEAARRLWEYLDRALDASDRQQVEAHLGLCRQCCGELEFAKVLHDYLAKQPAEDRLPEDVRHRLEHFIEELKP